MVHKKYFWLALVWGLVMVFMIPPFQTPDEDGHYYRAVAMSEGQYWCKGSQLHISKSAVNFVNFMEVDRIRIHPDQKFNWTRIADYRDSGGSQTTAVTNVLCPMVSFTHFPIAATLFITRTLGANRLQSFYLARITNLLIALFLMTLAIKTAPTGKWLLLALGLLPMTIQQFSSLNYDAILLPMFWLFSASVISKKYLGVFLVIPLILAKPAYLPILLVPFFAWPKAKKVVILAILLTLAAIMLQSRFWGGVSTLAITKPGLQDKITMAISKPWVVPGIVVNTWLSPARDWELLLQMLGKLGYSDYYLAPWVYVIAVGLLVLGILGSGDQWLLAPRVKLTIWLTTALTIFSIFVYLYFLETPLSRSVLIVRGVQGRYFLPLLYWLLLTFKKSKPWAISAAVYVFWFLLLSGTVLAVLTRYY